MEDKRINFKEFILGKIHGNLETSCRLVKRNGFLGIDLMLVSAFGVNIWGIVLFLIYG